MLRHALLSLMAMVLAGTGLVIAGLPAQAVGSANTLHWEIDSISSPKPGVLNITGWIFDQDQATTQVEYHVYIGGAWDSPDAVFMGARYTDQYRHDVALAYPGVGDYQGFATSMESPRAGSVPVYVYALNVAGTPGGAALIYAGTVAITSPDPGGSFSSAASPSAGQVSVAGYAFEMESNPEKTRVAVTTNDVLAGTLVADQKGPGFENFPVMFNGVLPSPSGDVKVCVTAINQGLGKSQLLGCRQVQVAAVPTPPVVTAPPAPPAPPRVSLRLKAVWHDSRLRIDVGPDAEQSNYTLRIQRKAGKKWRTMRRTQTLGPTDRITIDLRRGTYRVVVPPQLGLLGSRATVRIKR